MRRASALKAYKYCIYPTDAQVVFFSKTFGCCRFVWNKMLDEKLQAYKKKERLQRFTPTKYKEEFLFLKEVNSLALCNVQLQLEKVFKDHFRNRKQFKLPEFKKKRDKQSYTTNNTCNSIRVDSEKVCYVCLK
jgi:putative transposase